MAFEEGGAPELEGQLDHASDVNSNEDTGGGGQSQNQFSVSPDDWNQVQAELASLRQYKQDWSQKQASYDNDLRSYKEELSKVREDERRFRLLQAGDPEIIKDEQERRKNEAIQKELRKHLTELLPDLVQKGELRLNQGGSHLADQLYFSQASQKVHSMAKEEGFDDKGQKAMEAFGSFMIESVPQWKDRFYKGDLSVVDETAKWIKETILEPRDKYIENRVLERIRKQGKYAAPLPSRTGGGGVKVNNALKQDFNDPDARRNAFLKIAHSALTEN